jgi:Family of unknown function (DUF5683)
MMKPVIVKKYKLLILFFVFISMETHFCSAQAVPAKTDSVNFINKAEVSKEKTENPINGPKQAAIRSLILPGLGQAYNKKYWKVPIVWGALGTCGYVISYNLSNYKDLKQAYIGKYNARVYNDSTEYYKMDPNLVPLSEESLRYNRDQFRRNVDYSILVFAILWGINVMDAAVDAHLKSFDVSEDLSLKIKPGYSEIAGTNGLSLVLKIGR